MKMETNTIMLHPNMEGPTTLPHSEKLSLIRTVLEMARRDLVKVPTPKDDKQETPQKSIAAILYMDKLGKTPYCSRVLWSVPFILGSLGPPPLGRRPPHPYEELHIALQAALVRP